MCAAELEHLDKAKRLFSFVARSHAGQIDRGGQPYALHPIAVAELIATQIKNPRFDLISAGAGHDLKEGCGLSDPELLGAGFTPRSIEIINGVTRNCNDGLTYIQWIQKIIDFNDIDLMIVKYFDNIHNLSPRGVSLLKEDDITLVKRYSKSSMMLYDKIRARLKIR